MQLIVFVVDCSGGIEAGRKIAVSKNGSLNIYIAVDISESIEEHHINSSRAAIKTLITKVRNKQLSSSLKRNAEFANSHPGVGLEM